MRPADFVRIALTGGPSAGKTTVLAILRQKLRGAVYAALVVPEVAIRVFTSDISLDDILSAPERYEAFQRTIIAIQMADEDQWADLARLLPCTRKVLICDRDVPDTRAYMEPAAHNRLLANLGITLSEERSEIRLPAFMSIAREVTHDVAFRDYRVARKVVPAACRGAGDQWAHDVDGAARACPGRA